MDMRKILLLVTLFISSQIFAQSYTSAVDWHGKLRVSGSYILDERNDTVQLTGPSLFWSNTGWGGQDFYNMFVIETLTDEWEAPIVRAAMGIDADGGYIYDDSNKDRVKNVIDYAISYGIYVIVDWHSHHAEDYQTQAVAFFKEIAQEYGNYPNIIYEIYNEPLQISWSNVIKPYAQAVIDGIREYDSDNIIVVGTPSWSQGVNDAAADPIYGETNIAYTMHFYAGTHTQWLRDRTKQAMDDGICIVVTEWGMVNADGDGDVATEEVNLWIEFLEENHITNCIWALNDKNEGASMLKPGSSDTGFWSQSDLTDCGLIAYDLIKNSDGNWVGIEKVPICNVQCRISNDGVLLFSEPIVEAKIYDIQGRLLQVGKSLNVLGLQGVFVIEVLTEEGKNIFKIVR